MNDNVRPDWDPTVLHVDQCYECNKVFTYRPALMKGLPTCKRCANRINKELRSVGRAPIPIHPDTYKPYANGGNGIQAAQPASSQESPK